MVSLAILAMGHYFVISGHLPVVMATAVVVMAVAGRSVHVHAHDKMRERLMEQAISNKSAAKSLIRNLRRSMYVVPT